MPRPEEYCEVQVNGRKYRDWTAVQVVHDMSDPMFRATVSIVEPVTGTTAAQTKVRPGDAASVTLAGYKVIDGFVWLRQPAFDAYRKGVQIGVVGKTIDIVKSSVITKTGEFKGYTFEAIARSVLAPFNVNLVMRNPPAGAERPFDRVHVHPGETAWQLIERLARVRGITMISNPDGDLVAGQPENGPSQAKLEEGKNIWRARGVIRDDAMNGQIYGVGQAPGSDNRNGEAVASPSAFLENPLMQRYRPLLLISEQPSTKQDLQDRLEREKKQQAYTYLQLFITVQGWLRPDGAIWEMGKKVTLNSPTCDIENTDLAIQSVTFEQSDEGTTTTLELVTEATLGTGGVATGPGGAT
jgi:prophage tail gpP-like protein